jgi:hypothetical protein
MLSIQRVLVKHGLDEIVWRTHLFRPLAWIGRLLSFGRRRKPLGVRDRSELVHTIITLAARLGISTVAEGVETTAQLNQLENLGSASMQGFLFSRPVEANAVRRLLDG